jgi:hypothetical protein
MCAGNPNLKFEDSMSSEHCDLVGADDEFTALNYGVTTTPRHEWAIVIHNTTAKADMRHNRKLTPIEDLLKTNEAKAAKISRPEVIAVVLYTGPMVFFYLNLCMFIREPARSLSKTKLI